MDGNQTQPDGLVIVSNRGQLRLTVYSSRAIRIQYTERSEFSQRPSLMVVARPDERIRFDVRETPDSLSFSTADLTVEINRQTLALTYRDAAGNLLTREPARGGKTLEPVDVVVSVFDEATITEDSENVDGVRMRAGNVRQVGTLMAADQMMIEPARATVRTLAATGQPAYEFRFSYVAVSMRKQWPGAPHATAIPVVFDTVAARYGKDLADSDKAAAEAANAYWLNFARTGNPNGKGLPDWPAYNTSTDMLMDFTLDGPVAKPDPWKDRLDLAERLAEKK